MKDILIRIKWMCIGFYCHCVRILDAVRHPGDKLLMANEIEFLKDRVESLTKVSDTLAGMVLDFQADNVFLKQKLAKHLKKRKRGKK